MQKEKCLWFYFQNKPQQDGFIGECVKKYVGKTQRNTVSPKVLRDNVWEYILPDKGMSIKVCRGMIQALFQIAIKRIRVVQSKVLGGFSFEENRGSHTNRPHKLKYDVLDLLKAHLTSIPSKKSHYSIHKSQMNYFENSELNIKKLFLLFQEFYEENTGENLKMAYKTYFKYFKSLNFGFSVPKTDVCDFCTECDQKLKVNPKDSCQVDYTIHKKKVERYMQSKNKIIERSLT